MVGEMVQTTVKVLNTQLIIQVRSAGLPKFYSDHEVKLPNIQSKVSVNKM